MWSLASGVTIPQYFAVLPTHENGGQCNLVSYIPLGEGQFYYSGSGSKLFH